MLKFLVFAFCAALALAADPAGFTIWKAGDLKGYEKSLAPKIDQDKVATSALASYSNHRTGIAHREGNGQAELHEQDADLFVAVSGEATLVVGGTMPGSHVTAPGEHRAANVQGGSRHAVAPGDIIHIPRNTPHQLLVDSGKQFTYFTLKVTEK